jgi:hypothetical protein
LLIKSLKKLLQIFSDMCTEKRGRPQVKRPIVLSDFNVIWDAATDSVKNPNMKFQENTASGHGVFHAWQRTGVNSLVGVPLGCLLVRRRLEPCI